MKVKELAFIKDNALENAYPIFLAGNIEDVNAVEKILPNNIITQEFYRPIDAGESFPLTACHHIPASHNPKELNPVCSALNISTPSLPNWKTSILHRQLQLEDG